MGGVALEINYFRLYLLFLEGATGFKFKVYMGLLSLFIPSNPHLAYGR